MGPFWFVSMRWRASRNDALSSFATKRVIGGWPIGHQRSARVITCNEHFFWQVSSKKSHVRWMVFVGVHDIQPWAIFAKPKRGTTLHNRIECVAGCDVRDKQHGMMRIELCRFWIWKKMHTQQAQCKSRVQVVVLFQSGHFQNNLVKEVDKCPVIYHDVCNFFFKRITPAYFLVWHLSGAKSQIMRLSGGGSGGMHRLDIPLKIIYI